jgi:membrane-bound ClpP family serine protease
MVLLHGERWSAYSDEPIAKGEKVIVEAVSDLKVKVRKLG